IVCQFPLEGVPVALLWRICDVCGFPDVGGDD
ncbi:hypothetical protein RRG08_012336, partial [Elysia crispata]